MVKTIAALRQLRAQEDEATELCLENNFVYQYSATSVAADDASTVVRPVMTGAGRWVKLKEFTESDI